MIKSKAMYYSYFNLDKATFASAPNPPYIFKTKFFQTTCSQLLKGFRDGKTLGIITGKTGTGKTALCHYLISKLPTYKVATVNANPLLTTIELLIEICDQLQIEYPASCENISLILDLLDDFFTASRANNEKIMIFIDEAQYLNEGIFQHLDILINTHCLGKDKQYIVLAGQPELIKHMHTLNFLPGMGEECVSIELEPLSKEDTIAYINHRLTVGGAKDPVFTSPSEIAIHQYTNGVPRLINIICDHCLRIAQQRMEQVVTPQTVRLAYSTYSPSRLSGEKNFFKQTLNKLKDTTENLAGGLSNKIEKVWIPRQPKASNTLDNIPEQEQALKIQEKAKEPEKSEALIKQEKLRESEKPETLIKPEKSKEPKKSETLIKPENLSEPEKPETLIKPENLNDLEKSEALIKQEKLRESEIPETLIKPEKSKEPKKFETLIKPEKPKESEKPETLIKPENLNEPEKPEALINPEKPKESEKPETLIKPEKSKEPKKSETLIKPEKPKESEKPETLIKPENLNEPEKPEVLINPEKPKDSEKTEALIKQEKLRESEKPEILIKPENLNESEKPETLIKPEKPKESTEEVIENSVSQKRFSAATEADGLINHKPPQKLAVSDENISDLDIYPEGFSIPEGMVIVPRSTVKSAYKNGKFSVAAFLLDQTPVTNRQYAKYIEETNKLPPDYWWAGKMTDDLLDHPVVGVSYKDACDFAQWSGKRLPAPIEWESAARRPGNRKFPWGDSWEMSHLNCVESGLNKTTSVGSFPTGASLDGCLDLLGNVWEWTDANRANTAIEEKYAFVFGGSYRHECVINDAIARTALLQLNSYGYVGFRCAKDIL